MSFLDSVRGAIAAYLDLLSDGLGALSEFVFPAPISTNFVPPYTPPFTGGQCISRPYKILIQWSEANRGTFYAVFGGQNSRGALEPPADSTIRAQGNNVNGAITGINSIVNNNGVWLVTINGVSVAYLPQTPPSGFKISKVLTANSGIDNCGNLPSNIPPSSSNSSGLSTAPAPTLDIQDDGVNQIKEGLAPTSLVAALSGAIAAIKSASDTLDAIRNLADFAAELLSKLDDREDEEQNRFSLISKQFGVIEKDGYLRLYPDIDGSKFELILLEIEIISIPIFYGKVVSLLSPFRYPFKKLGYVCTVSPNFGIISFKDLEFKRVSIIPEKLATGIFFNLGLSGQIKARVTGFYQSRK